MANDGVGISALLHLILLLMQQSQTSCDVTGNQVRVLQHHIREDVTQCNTRITTRFHFILLVLVPYREEVAEELRDAGEGSSVAFVLRQAAAEQSQPALPHLHSQRASGGQELGALAALHVSHAQWLQGGWRGTGVAQRVEDKHHTQRREEQDDPAAGKRKGC